MATIMNTGLGLSCMHPSCISGNRPALRVPALPYRPCGATLVSSRRAQHDRCRCPVAAAAKGLSLHIGLNSVDPAGYEGWSGELIACENDASAMEAIAQASGYTPQKLLTSSATRKTVLSGLQAAAKDLKPGDAFLLTYSGHGGQVKDITMDERNDPFPDDQDETWCLYDGQLIDDELYYELCCFPEGVRILVLSDSCHSGTVLRSAPRLTPAQAAAPRVGAPPGPASKALPAQLAPLINLRHRGIYDGLQREVAEKIQALEKQRAAEDYRHPRSALKRRFAQLEQAMRAAVILISGCQDNQTSADGWYNGLFTEKLLNVWNMGAFQGNHVKFHKQIVARMPLQQTPNLYQLGPTAEFARQRPFTI